MDPEQWGNFFQSHPSRQLCHHLQRHWSHPRNYKILSTPFRIPSRRSLSELLFGAEAQTVRTLLERDNSCTKVLMLGLLPNMDKFTEGEWPGPFQDLGSKAQCVWKWTQLYWYCSTWHTNSRSACVIEVMSYIPKTSLWRKVSTHPWARPHLPLLSHCNCPYLPAGGGTA